MMNNKLKDWQKKTLGDISIITMGQSPSSASYNEAGIGSYLIQGNADIKNRKSSPRQWTSEPTKFCEIGDTLMTVRAPVGAIAKSKHKACIGRGVCSIKPNNSDNEFLYQFLLSYESKWKSLEQGSTFTAVNGTDIRGVKLLLPPISEQQKIADILSTVDAKIDLIDQQITETQELKKGLMQQLLTKGIGHTEFKESPLGEIPESWEVVKFNKVCDNSSIKFNKPFGKCIELEHIEQQTSRLLGYANIEDKSSVKIAFSIGDVLFCKLRPYLRKYWKCDFEGGCTSELMVLSPKSNLTTDYLFYTIQRNSFIENSVSKSYGTKMPRTSWKILSEFEMGLPSVEEQTKITKILSSIDNKLDVLTEKKTTYQELKQGLMQQLLTGKIRTST